MTDRETSFLQSGIALVLGFSVVTETKILVSSF